MSYQDVQCTSAAPLCCPGGVEARGLELVSAETAVAWGWQGDPGEVS